MVCEGCGKEDAKVHITEAGTDGTLTEYHLCRGCAESREDGGSLGGLLAASPSVALDAGQHRSPEGPVGPACTQCGMTEQEFQRSGRLGCGACYAVFSERVTGLLRRIHGSTAHKGKQPAACALPAGDHAPAASGHEQLAALQRDLDRAVASEDYENAARLRDRLRSLTAGSSG